MTPDQFEIILQLLKQNDSQNRTIITLLAEHNKLDRNERKNMLKSNIELRKYIRKLEAELNDLREWKKFTDTK